MDNLDQIVCKINETVKENMKDPRFTASSFYGLTEPRMHMDKVAPCVIQLSGDAKPIYTSDQSPVLIYHRLFRNSYAIAKSSIGRVDSQVRTSDMSMIICVKRKNVRMTNTEFESFLLSRVPQTLPSDFVSSLALKSIHISVQATDHNSYSIYEREWPGQQSLPSSFYMMEVRYLIGATYKPGCLIQCKN